MVKGMHHTVNAPTVILGEVADTGNTGTVFFNIGGNIGQYKIDWGDGTIDVFTNQNNPSHTYPANSGPYRIMIFGRTEYNSTKFDDFPTINLNTIRHAPLLEILFHSRNGVTKGRINELGKCSNLKSLFLTRAFNVYGDLNFLKHCQIGKNGGFFRFIGGNQSGLHCDINDLKYLSSDITTIKLEEVNLFGKPEQLLTLNNLGNLNNIEIAANPVNGSMGDGNTSIKQTSIKTLDVTNCNNLSFSRDLLKKSAFTDLEEIFYRNVKSVLGDNTFFSNLTGLKSYIQNQHPVDTADISPISTSIERFRCSQLTGDGTVFTNNSFPNLRRLESDANAFQLNIDAKHFDKAVIETLILTNGGLIGTFQFTQSQPLKTINFAQHNISAIDNTNNNFQLSNLVEINLFENAVSSASDIEGLFSYLNDPNLPNAPNGDRKVDLSGSGMAAITNTTDAQGIAAKGWIVNYNT